MRVEQPLAKPDRHRRHFEQFVICEVDEHARRDEQRHPRLQVPERVRDRLPVGAQDQNAVPPSCDRAPERRVAVKDTVHDRRAPGHGEQLAAVQHALLHGLVRPHGAALVQQTVDQGRLVVVVVRDDGDVAEVHGRGYSSRERSAGRMCGGSGSTTGTSSDAPGEAPGGVT